MRGRGVPSRVRVALALVIAAIFVVAGGAVSASATALATVTLTVNSFTRDVSTGELDFNVTGNALDLVGTGTCPGTPYSCHMYLNVESPDGTSTTIGDHDLTAPSDSDSFDFDDHVASTKVIAVQVEVRSANTVYTPWVNVDDSYPAQTGTTTVSSVGRDPATGQLTMNIAGSISNGELPDSACPSTDSTCTMELQAQMEDDSNVSSLHTFTMPSTISSSYTHSFTDPVTVGKITSVRIEVRGGHHLIDSPWVSVPDPLPSASISTTVNSVLWDSSANDLDYNVTGTLSDADYSDADCAAFGSVCHMGLQAQDLDGSVEDVALFTMPSGPGASYSHPFDSSISGLGDIVAVRTYLEGSIENVYGDWTAVSPGYPSTTASLGTGSYNRDPTSGDFTFNVVGTVNNYVVPGGICANTSGSCVATLEGIDSEGQLVSLEESSVTTDSSAASLMFDNSSPSGTGHLTAVRLTVAGSGGTVHSAWQTVDDPHSDPTGPTASISTSVTSVTRDTLTGAFDYDVTAGAAGFGTPGVNAVCDTTFYAGCYMSLWVQFEDGTSESISSTSFSASAGTYSYEFHSTAQLPQVAAVQTVLLGGNGAVYSGWTSVDDEYPSQSLSLSVTSVSRNTSNAFVYATTGTASNYWLPDSICHDTGSACTMVLQAEEADGSVVPLQSASYLGGKSYPDNEPLDGTMAMPQVTALRVGLISYGQQTYSGWTSVPDTYATGTVSISAASVSRDPATDDLIFSASTTASDYQQAGGVCSEGYYQCDITLQALQADGTVTDLTYDLDISSTYTHTFTSPSPATKAIPQVTAVRAMVAGPAGQIFSAWRPVDDTYPAPTGSIVIHTLKRNSSLNLVYDFRASAANYVPTQSVCDASSGSCDMGVQVEETDGTIQDLPGEQYYIGDPFPHTHTFSDTISLPQVVAVRVAVEGYNGDYFSPWQKVNDPWAKEEQALNRTEKNCGCTGGDPVQTGTGEFDQSATDDAIAGSGPSLDVDRSYQSTNATNDGPFGFGWSANFESQLVGVTAGSPPDGVLQVVQENGATAQFTRQGDGTYAAPDRVFATLSYDPTSTDWTFTRQAKQVMIFDANGQLLSFNDLSGNAVTVGYTAGIVTSLSASGGRSIGLTWTGTHVTGLTDSAGRTVAYNYDSSGNLTSVSAVDGSTTDYGYDTNHNMTTVTSPNGGVMTNVYDSSDRVTSQTDALGRETDFSYGDDITTTTNPNGSETVDTYNQGRAISQTLDSGTALAATTSWTYDDAGNVLTETDPLGNITTYTYDGAGNPLTKTDALGHTTTWTYDALNDVTSVTDPLGRVTTTSFNTAGEPTTSTSPSGRVQHITYNTNGTIASTEDARGKTTTFSYNTAGDPTGTEDPDSRTTSTGYNSAGLVTSKTDGAGHVTSDTVDAEGRVLTSTDPNSHTTTYTYDLDGNQLTVEDPDGHTTSKTYDLDDEVTSSTDARGKTTSYTYNAAGELATTTDPDSHALTNTYDLLGELTAVEDANSHTTSYAYDADGRKLTTTLPSGDETSTAYDAAGRATSTTDAKGKITTTVYDADDEATSSTDPLSQVTHTSYTADGQVHIVTLPDGSTETSTYNADGATTEFTNADGKNTTYSYDNADLLTSKVEPGSQETDYSYDSAGRLHVTTKPDGSTLTDSYDSAGQLVGEHSSVTGSTDIAYTYDPAGRRASMTDETGTTTYTYNADSQLSTATNGAGAEVGYGYDDAGLMTSIVYPGSRTVSYTYDPVGQMSSMTDWNSNETDFTWTPDGQLATQADPGGVTETRSYDADDQTTGIADAKSGTTLANYTYGYDDSGDISSDGTVDPIGTTSHTYGYSSDSQLTTVASGSATAAYGQTAAGELTSDTNDNALAYNGAQELTSFTPVTGPAVSYAYDDNGSRTSSTVAEQGTTAAATTNYTYDAEANLASVTVPGATSASVSYTSDGDGLRQTRTTGTGTTDFTWDVSGSLPLLLDDGMHSYVYGPSSAPVAQVDDSTGAIGYLHGDLLGSTRLITNSSGAVTGTTEYDSYGNRTNHAGTADSAIGYSGNWTDPTTGFVYLRARDYDPTTAQLLTVDPDVDTTRQPYAYVADDPLDNADPTGLNCDGSKSGFTKTSSPSTGDASGKKTICVGYRTPVCGVTPGNSPEIGTCIPHDCPSGGAPSSFVVCIGGAAGSLYGASVEGCAADLPSGWVFFGDWGYAEPGAVGGPAVVGGGADSVGKANGFGGVLEAGGVVYVGSTNATSAKQLSGYFNVQSASAGEGPASVGGSYASAKYGKKTIWVALGGWAPGVGLPVNYTNINTDTYIAK